MQQTISYFMNNLHKVMHSLHFQTLFLCLERLLFRGQKYLALASRFAHRLDPLELALALGRETPACSLINDLRWEYAAFTLTRLECPFTDCLCGETLPSISAFSDYGTADDLSRFLEPLSTLCTSSSHRSNRTYENHCFLVSQIKVMA